MGMPASSKAMAFVVTRDREAAKAFYAGILGFELTHEDDFAAVFDLNGTMLRISTAADHVPQPHTILGWEVTNIVETVDALRGLGVVFSVYDGLGQDASGIWSPPGGSRIAWFHDPDGNVLSLAQF